MNCRIIVIAITSFISTNLYAETGYEIVPERSSLSFSTIKNQYIVETASITPSEGTLDKNGFFSITLPIDSIDTGISIRDERLKSLFFDIKSHSQVHVSGKIDLNLLSNEPELISLPVNVQMYGKVNSIIFPVVIMKSNEHMLVSSYSQRIIHASDFGIPSDNLVKLAATVGGIKISDNVPVSFTLTFGK